MKKLCSISLLFVILFFSHSCKTSSDQMITGSNPLLNEFNTPFNVPDFEVINEDHFLPAFKESITKQQEEIKTIIANPAEPTFENTIVAFAHSGLLLHKVENIFYNLLSAHTNNRMQELAKEVAPMVSAHEDDIKLNPDLFLKVKKVFDEKEQLDLAADQDKLLEKIYKLFVRGGANLNDEDQKKLRGINQELSVLTLQFGENVLNETNEFRLVIENEEDLSGLPETVIQAASEAAAEAGEEGKWVFTLHRPSLTPFLQYANNRELRKKIFNGYITRGNNNNKNDNKEIIQKIAVLRLEKAKILGYNNHAEYVLEENMAKIPDNVYNLLYQLWDASLPMAEKEAAELQSLIDKEGGNFTLEPWDWWYYAEKLRKEKYALDEKVLRPYFKLENVRDGVFDVCHNLYGLTFRERKDIPVYHEDVQVFEVMESDNSHVGIVYMDFFPRASKRGGAWMNSFRKQYRINGTEVTPVITTVFNFSKPAGDKPALLSFEEVSTLFHEFGHALHGLLSNCTYRPISGTSVSRDFVELPSQIMENWAAEPYVLKSYAKHYETDEPIPDELIEKIKKSSHFNQGFITVEYLAAAFLDMDWHMLKEFDISDVNAFESKSLNNIGLIPEIVVRYRSTYFNHIFSGGYSSGYYSYIWSAVLDADAFEAFKETSLFDQKTAESFRINILEKGGSEDPMTLYIRFRGAEPSIEPLLKRRGLKS